LHIRSSDGQRPGGGPDSDLSLGGHQSASPPFARITPVRAKGRYAGWVEAPDAEAAIKAAIKRFGITDPQQQRRLVAQPVE